MMFIKMISIVLLVALGSFGVYGAENPATFYLTTKAQNISLDLNHNADKINPLHPIKFIIHGWTENANRSHYVDMANAYLNHGDYNVIRVDYSNLSRRDYISAIRGFETVGKYVGEFIVGLHQQFGIPLSNIHVIGHSLGGQVSGSAGKYVQWSTGSRISRITTLDPARPGFETQLAFNVSKLSRTDADFVDIIHTDSGVHGLLKPAGTVDFYPNGGRRLQPGCEPSYNSWWDIIEQLNLEGRPIRASDDFCSHSRSHSFFIESISTTVMATKCDSWENYKKGVCDDNEKVAFGENIPSTATPGSYFLITASQSPYLMQNY